MPSNRAIEAGRAVLRIVAVDSGVRGVLNEVESALEETANRAKSIGVAITATGLAGLGTIGAAVREASRAEEIASKFETVFGAATESMRIFFRALADEVGRSEVDLQEFGAGFQDLLQPIGFDPAAAREFSQVLTALAIDLGSFNDRSDSDVVRDLQAAITGSSETVKRYGVIVNEAAVKQELLNRNIDITKATDVDKVYARIAIILAQTTAAQGDAARTAGSVANQFKALGSAIRDASVAIGTALLPVVRPVLSVLTVLAQTVRNVAENFPILSSLAAGVAVAMTLFGTGLTAAAVAVGFLLSPVTLLSIALALAGTSMGSATFAAGRFVLSLLTLSGVARAAASSLGFLSAAARLFVATPIGAAITAAVVILPLLAAGFGLAANEARAASASIDGFVRSLSAVEESEQALATLRQLAQSAKLSTDELAQAQALLTQLGKQYSDLGIRVDFSTGKIDALDGAFARLEDRLKSDGLEAASSGLAKATEKVAELEGRIEQTFNSDIGPVARSSILDSLRGQLAEAKKEAEALRATLNGLRSEQAPLPASKEDRQRDSLNERLAKQLRDEEIANIEDDRTRRIESAKEAAQRELAEAEKLGSDKTLIEKRLALEVARINREIDQQIAKENSRNREREARDQAQLERERGGLANERREAELRVLLSGRELELALLREQEQEKIKLARERGLAVLDIEREFAAKRALVNRQFDKREEERAERDRKEKRKGILQRARSLEISGTLATRVAGQQFSRGGERVAVESLQELKGINRRLARIERQPNGIKVL